MLATATSASIVGVDGVAVRVEVDVAFGLPGLTIVGLAGSAVLEARERVRAAIRNSGFEVPSRRITVNLAPASETTPTTRRRRPQARSRSLAVQPAWGSGYRRCLCCSSSRELRPENSLRQPMSPRRGGTSPAAV